MTQPQSWSIKGSAILQELVALMGVSDADAALLKALSGEVASVASALTDDFYKRLFAHEPTAEYLQGVETSRLHSMVQDWFADIFNGVYNDAYAERRLQIGIIHVRIGLPVRYPLAMLDVVMEYASKITAKSSDPEAAANAFRKVLALDVALFNQAYEDNQLHHLSELIGGERLARRLLAGQM